MPPHISSGRGFGHEFGRFDHRHDVAFRHHDFDRFRDRDFDRDDRSFTTVISSSVLISLRLASLGGTPTTTTTRTIIPTMTTDRLTITSIGTIWLCLWAFWKATRF
jgi:hypothetical protein